MFSRLSIVDHTTENCVANAIWHLVSLNGASLGPHLSRQKNENVCIMLKDLEEIVYVRKNMQKLVKFDKFFWLFFRILNISCESDFQLSSFNCPRLMKFHCETSLFH